MDLGDTYREKALAAEQHAALLGLRDDREKLLEIAREWHAMADAEEEKAKRDEP